MPQVELNNHRYEIQIIKTIEAQPIPPAGVHPGVQNQMNEAARERLEIVPDLVYTQIIFECPADLGNTTQVRLHRAIDNLEVFGSQHRPAAVDMQVSRYSSHRNTYLGRY